MPNDAAVKFEDGDRALVIGVGRSGMATAAVLRDRGLRVAAYDDKQPQELAVQRAALERIQVDLVGKDGLSAAAADASVAILSPGVPLNNPAVLAVQRAGVPVISEIEAAYRIAKAPIIAITGSKGKSTTTALIGHLLGCAGVRARVGGNIGSPLILEAAAASADEWLVAEVSSFQLEAISTFRPRISVLLNISPDHLDRYHSMEEYREAKFRIFANQGEGDFFIGNADDPAIVDAVFGATRRVPCLHAWYSVTGVDNVNLALVNGAIVRQSPGIADTPIVRVDQLHIKGSHNVGNAMAAYLAASLAALASEADVEKVAAGLQTFRPLPHRLQTVARSNGITWVDDSKASNPDAVLKALETFTEPIILIAGGRSKRTDFRALAAAASEHAKLVILIGESAREIGALIEHGPIVFAESIEQAVAAAAEAAVSGDVVLLSPGCASFDMFESAEQRGEVFAAAVRRQTGISVGAR